MKIKDITLHESSTKVTLWATCKIRRAGYDKVYFAFDKSYKSALQVDASPFAAALLLPSMKLGEDLIIEGKISKQLLDGMEQIMHVVSGWNIGLKPIKIKAEQVEADVATPKTVATFFSGGVDSFYTYLKHKNDHKNPVTHLVLVNGYDIDPRNSSLWGATQHNVQAIAAEEKVELVEVESNIRPLIEPILSWDYTHGGCLAAVGLCLRKQFGLIYVPSSYTTEQLFPWGSHPAIDSLWSTENLTFSHDGNEASRANKVAWQIAKSSSALKHLRVCYLNVRGTYNCGICDKCLRTMINLYLAGVLEKSSTFPRTIDVNRVAALPIEGEHGAIFHKENLAALKARNLFPELQEALVLSIKNVKEVHNPRWKRFALRVLYVDHMYSSGLLYKAAFSLIGRKY